MSKAVFLSYASQDADAARRIADVLRAAGVEVWFDRSELRGGDAWDQKIRRQIKECALFVPVISAHTQARPEGYFRLEWKLAVDRSHLMADDQAFLVPVAIDDTPQANARVPEKFQEVQWTRLIATETPTAFAARMRDLLEPGRPRPGPRGEGAPAPAPDRRARRKSPWRFILIPAGLLAVAGGAMRLQRDQAPPAALAATSPPAAPRSEVERLSDQAYAHGAKLAFTRDDLLVAEDLARKATELDPGSARAWSVRAFVHAAYINRAWDTSEKRRQDTEAFANRALSLDEGNPEALYARALVVRSQGAFAQSETLLRQALKRNPPDGYVARALAFSVQRQGRVDESRRIMRAWLDTHPRDTLTHYNLASSYANIAAGINDSPDVEQALVHYDAALATEPFASAMLQKAGLVAAWKGDLVTMRKVIDKMSALSSMDRSDDRSVFVAMWGGLVERRPDRVRSAGAQSARPYFEDNTVARPKTWLTAIAYRVEGKEALARGEWEAAERVLRERVRRLPETDRERAQLAITLAWLGRTAEAAEAIAPTEAALRDAGSQTVHTGRMAGYYGALGDGGKAALVIKPVLDLNFFLTRHSLRLDPWWDKVRDHPDFQALLADPK